MSTDKLNSELSRRDFVKVAAAGAATLIAAPAILEAAQPAQALAATPATTTATPATTVAATTGTICTCNVYCQPDLPLIRDILKIGKGYLTNPTVPNSIFTGPWPNTPVSNNATYVMQDGVYVVTVNLVNTVFTLTYCPMPLSGEREDGVGTAATIVSGIKPDDHYTQLTVHIPQAGEYKFSGVNEYAALPPVTGPKEWPLYIDLEL